MAFADAGFEVLENILEPEEIDVLLIALEQQKLPPLKGGIRRIEQKIPAIAGLAKSNRMMALAKCYLNPEPQLVRAIYFCKSPANNWLVTWHQDKSIAVSERFAAEGWGAWSLKAGVWHVQPPLAVL